MPHKIVFVFALILAGCGVAPAPPPRACTPVSWRLSQRETLLVFEPDVARRVLLEIRYLGSQRPAVGEVVAVEIRIPDASVGVRHTCRVRSGHSGLRLLDSDRVELSGPNPTLVRFTSDLPGAAEVIVEME